MDGFKGKCFTALFTNKAVRVDLAKHPLPYESLLLIQMLLPKSHFLFSLICHAAASQFGFLPSLARKHISASIYITNYLSSNPWLKTRGHFVYKMSVCFFPTRSKAAPHRASSPDTVTAAESRDTDE